MSKVSIHTKVSKSIIVFCLLLFLRTPFVEAAEDITGEWEIKIDSPVINRLATLSFSKKPDGSLMGTCGSSKLANVRFENGKLSFSRIIKTRARDFKHEYTLTLKDGKLTGTMSGDLGNFPVNGIRKKALSPALGQWDIITIAGKVEITGRLIISENPEGALVGKWDYGREEAVAVVSNVKFKDGKLSFTRMAKLSYIRYGKLIEHEFEENFEGTIKGHELTGVTRSSEGSEFSSTGKRVGAALVGNWELTRTSDGKTTTSIMKIYGDLTGKYSDHRGDEVTIKNLKLEGDQVTFFLEWGSPDMSFRVNFKGKLDGNILKGEFNEKTIKGKQNFDEYTNKVIGKKID